MSLHLGFNLQEPDWKEGHGEESWESWRWEARREDERIEEERRVFQNLF